MIAKWIKNALCFVLLASAGSAAAQQFSNVTATSGAQYLMRSTNLAWGDYDGDGDFDIYVTNWATQYEPLPVNALWRNEGEGNFADVTDAAHLGQEHFLADGGNSTAAAWADYDNDGDMDLFFVNREQEYALLRNDGGTVTEVFCALSMANMEVGQKSSWADYDNDGDLDLYLANIGANALYRNDGGDSFEDVSAAAGVRYTGANWLSAGAVWSDYDGDGYIDLFLVSGGDRPDTVERLQVDVLLQNNGDGSFRNATTDALPFLAGFFPTVHIAAGWADYDGNGSPDLYAVDSNVGLSNQLYRNETPAEKFIRVRLIGKGPEDGGSNRDAIGTQVWLLNGADEVLAYQQVLPGPSAPELIFGTPEGAVAYTLRARFPRTGSEVRLAAAAGERIDISEP